MKNSDYNSEVQNIKLSDFVSQTITEIAQGMAKAAESLSDSDVVINPFTQDGMAMNLMYSGRGVQQIDFDVSVVASSKDANSGGLHIAVLGMFSGGASAESSAGQSYISRLRFSIPVCFPLYEGKS